MISGGRGGFVFQYVLVVPISCLYTLLVMQGKTEAERKEILQEWLDCYVTDDGFLMARQRPGKRPPSLTRLIDGWLDHYRHMAFRCLGEEGDSDDNDEWRSRRLFDVTVLLPRHYYVGLIDFPLTFVLMRNAWVVRTSILCVETSQR